MSHELKQITLYKSLAKPESTWDGLTKAVCFQNVCQQTIGMWAWIILCGGGNSVPCRMFSSIPGPYLLDVNDSCPCSPQVMKTKHGSRHCQSGWRNCLQCRVTGLQGDRNLLQTSGVIDATVYHIQQLIQCLFLALLLTLHSEVMLIIYTAMCVCILKAVFKFGDSALLLGASLFVILTFSWRLHQHRIDLTSQKLLQIMIDWIIVSKSQFPLCNACFPIAT